MAIQAVTHSRQLPIELGRMVCTFLDIRTTMTIVARVCKIWNHYLGYLFTDGHLDLTPCRRLDNARFVQCVTLINNRLAHEGVTLRSLKLKSCKMEQFPTLTIDNLRSLDLTSTPKLHHSSLKTIARLPFLTYLNLAWCTWVTDLSSLKNIFSLRSLDLTYTYNLHQSSLKTIAQLPLLTYLNLAWCTWVTDLSSLKNTFSLRSLDLTYMTWMENDHLDQLPLQLTDLRLRFCTRITSVAPLAKMKQLRILDLTGVHFAFDIDAIKRSTLTIRQEHPFDESNSFRNLFTNV